MTKHTMETVTFKLNKGVSAEDFSTAATAITAYASGLSGFVMRRLSCTEDGLWIEHIQWETLADAQAAAAGIGSEASLADCMGMIDPETVAMYHSTLEISVN
jgi:hypothetical protein